MDILKQMQTLDLFQGVPAEKLRTQIFINEFSTCYSDSFFLTFISIFRQGGSIEWQKGI